MKTYEEEEGRPSPSSLEYESFVRPLTGRLLRALEMNIHFHHGQGNWLEANILGEVQNILDLTGGYGANLLGHKNPQLLSVAINHLSNGDPNLTQGSSRQSAGLLGEKLSSLLEEEISEGPWITAFSNSGSEAVEAALKHCLLDYSKSSQARRQSLQKNANETKIFLNLLNQQEQSSFFQQWRTQLIRISQDLHAPMERLDWLLHMVQQSQDVFELASIVCEFNEKQFSMNPVTIAIEKGFHGKTLGSLSLTHNPKYRSIFHVDEARTLFLKPTLDEKTLEDFFDSQNISIIEFISHDLGVTLKSKEISRICGLFVEPIQGEAGVNVLPNAFLAQLKKFSLSHKFSLVFDEIQAGLYRTGKLASGHHAGVSADIYCFSKALGGGLAKIGATCINKKIYQDDFGLLHTSTFSEDSYSSTIALEVLKLAKTPGLIESAMTRGSHLKEMLLSLKEKFPHLIKEVRGQGLMLALEFSENILNLSFEFRVFNDAGMLGYLITSALLHNENLRLSPSLSNGLSLRIQPSLYVTVDEMNFLMNGLESLLREMEIMNFSYFSQHLYPQAEIENIPGAMLNAKRENPSRPLTVFLCHFIDDGHIKKITPAFSSIDSITLDKKISLFKDVAEFGEYHVQALKNKNGKEIDVMLMGIPITSAELKKSFMSYRQSDLIAKVQSALDKCHSLGVSTVGLGQFTSIISGNGLYLNSHGMNLTTGNAYTIALALQAAKVEAHSKGIDLGQSSVGIVGAAGNIMSVAAALIADEAKKLVLIHHTELEKSSKLQQVVKVILRESLSSDRNSEFNKVLKQRLDLATLQDPQKLVDWIMHPEQNDLIEVSSDLNLLKECTLILAGASSGKGFLTPEHFQVNAIIVDVAVPANIQPDVLQQLRQNRPDVSYLLGGIAKLPHNQSIVTQIFPLPQNQSFACMAETFTLGFGIESDLLHTGNLTKELVRKVEALATDAGFELGAMKTKNSL